MRVIAFLSLVVIGCSSPAVSTPHPFVEVSPPDQQDDAGQTLDAAEDTTEAGTVGEHDAEVPDAGNADVTNVAIDPYFGMACQELQPPASDCGDNTICYTGFTNYGATGYDSGVGAMSMHDHCTWGCTADADCTGTGAPHPGGYGPPGSRCIPGNDGFGHVSLGVCMPPPDAG